MKKAFLKLRRNAPLMVILASVFFAAMAACVKAISASIPIEETVFFRSVIPAVIFGMLLVQRKISFRVKKPPLMLIRSLMGLLAMICKFYALGYLALGDAAVLSNTAPIFVAIFSIFYLKERPSRPLFLWILLAWVGILFILRPHFQFLNYAGLIALCGAMLVALVINSLHRLRETEPVIRIAFYFSLLCTLFSLPLLLKNFVVPDALGWSLLLASGVFGTIGQFFITKAYGLQNVSSLAPLTYINVVAAFALGIIFWDEIPSIGTFLGSAVVIFACLKIARIEKTEPVVTQ